MDVAAALPLDYESNMDYIYDTTPEWDGWEFPFERTCQLCISGDHELCQETFHLACRCFQLDHEPEGEDEEWEEF